MQTYSPWLNRFETDANSEFTLDFPMGGAFETVRNHDGAERIGTVFVTPPTLDARHEVRVAASRSPTAAARAARARCGRSRPRTTPHINRPPVAASQSLERARRTERLGVTLERVRSRWGRR